MMAAWHIKLSHIKKQQARGVHTSCAAAVAGRGVAAVVALCTCPVHFTFIRVFFPRGT
jgi:hypothetical protein